MWFVFFLACQLPFDSDRHRLSSNRIAAIETSVDLEEQTVSPRLFLVSDSQLWSEQEPQVRWAWTQLQEDEITQLEPMIEADGIGPSPTLSGISGRIAVRVEWTDGTVRWASLKLDDPSPLEDATLISAMIDSPLVDQTTADELALSERMDWTAQESTSLSPNHWHRLTFQSDFSNNVRWMSTLGSFLEITSSQTHFALEDVSVDDEEVFVTESGSPTTATVMALSLRDGGAHQVLVRDFTVSAGLTGIMTPSGRFVQTDADIDDSTYVRGVVQRSLSSSTGFELIDAESVDSIDTDQVDPFGTEGLLCATDLWGAFEPNWLLNGVCGLQDVDGLQVIIEREVP